ncbi:MAG: discoidin domain-containing protein [Bacteroidales bacterium]|jgi:hypothetical protein|nr:discoidin domain-containing protein [Bacteroidales bacterium]
MKTILFFISWIFALYFVSCADMNENVDEYLNQGEIIYIAKSDSVKLFAGRERFLLTFWLSDPRTSELRIYWSQKADFLSIPITEADLGNQIDAYIGRNEKTIEEGNYTLQLIAYDILGNASITDEYNVNVYGETFASQQASTPKFIKKAAYSVVEDSLSIIFGSTASSREYGINLTYTDNNGVYQSLNYTSEKIKSELNDSLSIMGIDISQPISYVTKYLPETTAIDTFYTEVTVIEPRITYPTFNVALGKTVTHSDCNPANNTGQMAVDGIKTGNETRWVSDDLNGEHWIIIDLGQEYVISGFKTWGGSPAQAQFRFEAEIDGAWVPLVTMGGNTLLEYSAEFDEVATSKVRYYIPAYTTNRVRLYEIEVYGRQP